MKAIEKATVRATVTWSRRMAGAVERCARVATAMRAGALVIATLASASCSGPAPTSETLVGPEAEERPALVFTNFTDTTELFAELRALVVAEDSPVAAHVTRLSDFSALADGAVAVILERPDGAIERFEADAASQPGIFRPVVRPSRAGPAELRVEIRAPGIDAVHVLGDVEVFLDDEAARAAIPAQAEPVGRITFLKEQQWVIPFATTLVARRSMRSSIHVFGYVETRSDGDVVVTAPSAGRITDASLPTLGASVASGDTLASIAPRLAAADRATLDLAVSSARADVAQAEREHARLTTLRAEGAVPDRRVVEAEHVEAEARAALTAAQRRLAAFQRTLRTGGSSTGALPVRAPIAGDLTEIHVAPGQLVDDGAPLFRIVTPGSTWLTLDVPESDLSRITLPLSGSFRVPGETSERSLAAEALVAITRVVDPESRSAPVRFALEGTAVASGTHVEGRLFFGEATHALAIPWSSVLDDGGVRVAFVEVEGESFARRVLRLGPRDGDWVAVQAGLADGERVVSTGALAVRLAGASGTVPAHGHSH